MAPGISANVGHIECPKCGSISEFECWSVVPNVFVPEVAEAAREGLLFEFECDTCGYRDLAPYQCLYHDIPHARLILLEPNPEKRAAAEAELARMTSGQKRGEYEDVPRHVGRLVFHPDRFSEKARIFEAELDDCAIELLKLQVKERLVGEDPLFETALIYFSRAGEGSIVFMVAGYEDYSAVIPMAAYEQILLDFMMDPPSVEGFVVDESWAASYLLGGVMGEAGDQL